MMVTGRGVAGVKVGGATYGPRATSGPRTPVFRFKLAFFDSNLVHGTQIKVQCGPRIKIVASPWVKGSSKEKKMNFLFGVLFMYFLFVELSHISIECYDTKNSKIRIRVCPLVNYCHINDLETIL